jgi:hypothetical protein
MATEASREGNWRLASSGRRKPAGAPGVRKPQPMGPLELVKLPVLMQRTSGRADICVGLIDGPVLFDHPDVAGQNSPIARGSCAPWPVTMRVVGLTAGNRRYNKQPDHLPMGHSFPYQLTEENSQAPTPITNRRRAGSAFDKSVRRKPSRVLHGKHQMWSAEL